MKVFNKETGKVCHIRWRKDKGDKILTYEKLPNGVLNIDRHSSVRQLKRFLERKGFTLMDPDQDVGNPHADKYAILKFLMKFSHNQIKKKPSTQQATFGVKKDENHPDN